MTDRIALPIILLDTSPISDGLSGGSRNFQKGVMYTHAFSYSIAQKSIIIIDYDLHINLQIYKYIHLN